MDNGFCKIKCVSCGKQVFEFSFNLLKEAGRLRFSCKNCGEWTVIKNKDDGELDIYKG